MEKQVVEEDIVPGESRRAEFTTLNSSARAPWPRESSPVRIFFIFLSARAIDTLYCLLQTVKVVYTIAPSQQALVARHRRLPVTVLPCDDTASSSTTIGYANLPLKVCLQAICRSRCVCTCRHLLRVESDAFTHAVSPLALSLFPTATATLLSMYSTRRSLLIRRCQSSRLLVSRRTRRQAHQRQRQPASQLAWAS